MQQVKKRGGPRPGSGRKTHDGAKGLTRHMVTLDPETVGMMRLIGEGQLSLGIRRAAILAREKVL